MIDGSKGSGDQGNVKLRWLVAGHGIGCYEQFGDYNDIFVFAGNANRGRGCRGQVASHWEVADVD